MMNDVPVESYYGKKVLITGGLGFIGSTLAERLVGLGAKVRIMDSMLKDYGSNYFNVEGIRNDVEIDNGDIRDPEAVRRNVAGQDIIFSMAAQVGESIGRRDPLLDAGINCVGHLNILQTCKMLNPQARIVFPGSRFQYGRVNGQIPVSEERPMNPLTPYAISKVFGEQQHIYFNREHGLDTVCARIANPFGPKVQVKSPAYGIVNWFVRKALEDGELTPFGDGKQLRDYIYSDDLANALLYLGIKPEAKGKVYNVGTGEGVRFVDMAHKVVEMTGSGRVVHKPWPAGSEKFETGDFVADVTKLRNLGWRPEMDFESGLRKTIDFYREHLGKYI